MQDNMQRLTERGAQVEMHEHDLGATNIDDEMRKLVAKVTSTHGRIDHVIACGTCCA